MIFDKTRYRQGRLCLRKAYQKFNDMNDVDHTRRGCFEDYEKFIDYVEMIGDKARSLKKIAQRLGKRTGFLELVLKESDSVINGL
jgi:hypothetical protein